MRTTTQTTATVGLALMLAGGMGCDDSNADEESPAVQFVVVDTMQKDCYDLDGEVIDCGTAYLGQDAEYTTVVADHTVSDDVVSDNNTGLMWEYNPSATQYSVSGAADYCEAQESGGYSDWRLPTIKELQSIVAYGKTEVPAIDTDFFDCTFNESYGGADFDGDYGWYRTSTTLGDFPDNACYFAFGRACSTTDDLDGETVEYHDWHGAGAQRSDPKDGVVTSGEACSVTACDQERGVNYVRRVRG